MASTVGGEKLLGHNVTDTTETFFSQRDVPEPAAFLGGNDIDGAFWAVGMQASTFPICPYRGIAELLMVLAHIEMLPRQHPARPEASTRKSNVDV